MANATDPLAKQLAAERIGRAMEKVEKAQNLLDEAAQELCPIIGMLRRWEVALELSSKCKSLWHLLANSRRNGSYRVDQTALNDHAEQVQP